MTIAQYEIYKQFDENGRHYFDYVMKKLGYTPGTIPPEHIIETALRTTLKIIKDEAYERAMKAIR